MLKNKIFPCVNCIVSVCVYSPQPFSSLLSLQSLLWSHTWLDSTQFPLSHLNFPGGQVGSGVWHSCGSSSDSSPQSLSPSHWKSCEIQRPFWQVNWCCWHAWYRQPCSSLLSPQSLRRSHLPHRTDARQMFVSVSKWLILYCWILPCSLVTDVLTCEYSDIFLDMYTVNMSPPCT